MRSQIFVDRLNPQRMSKTCNYLYRDSKCRGSKSRWVVFFQIVEECCQMSVMFSSLCFRLLQQMLWEITFVPVSRQDRRED